MPIDICFDSGLHPAARHAEFEKPKLTHGDDDGLWKGGGHKWQMLAARQPGLELITMQLNNTINAIKITINMQHCPQMATK